VYGVKTGNLTLPEVETALNIAKAIFITPTSRVNRLNLLQQLSDTMRRNEQLEVIVERHAATIARLEMELRNV
jgi:hypothetical protein